MSSYLAYSLTIASAVPLPAPRAPEGTKSDVQISHSAIIQRNGIEKDDSFDFRDDGLLLSWDQVGSFLVREGRVISVDAKPGVSDSLILLPLLGIVMASLLEQRGRLVLHASAVSIGGIAGVFIGDKGWGKSTMIAALQKRGHSLLADDVVVIDSDPEGRLTAPAGFSPVKLWPDAAAALWDDYATLPQVAPGIEKRVRQAPLAPGPAAVRSLYLLGEGPDLRIKRLDAREALAGLCSNLYSARFGTNSPRDMRARTFSQCAHLVRTTPAYLLQRPSSLSMLDDVAQAVEEHILLHCPDLSRPSG